MLATVFAKTFRDRWPGWAIAGGVISSFVVIGMLAYDGIDLSMLEAFPEAYRSLLGLQPGMDAGALAISAIYGSYGAMTFAAMALVMGAAALAGEERKGTIGLLLANPKSRTHILVSKTLVLVLLSTLSTLAMWGISVGCANLFDIGLGNLDVMALNVHMFANTLFYGFLALAIGSATGNRGAAVGTSIGLMVVGFLGAGILPMLEGGKDWAKLFPWYYFNGSDPLTNGIDWSHVGLLAGLAAVFWIVAVIGFNRRDLKGQSVGVTMLDRLRANPMTKKVADRLGGSARVSSIWAKTASEHQISLFSAVAYMFLIGLMLGAFWRALPQDVFAMYAQLPEGISVMFELFGGGDITTAAGFVQIETFGMMGPIMVMLVTISIGANAVAGEEAKRTMGLLLANPISRGKLIAEKTFTMIFYAAIVGVLSFAGTMLGSIVGDQNLEWQNVAAICSLLTLIGLVGGGLALAIGAATGRKGAAVWGSIGFMVAMHVMNSLGEIAKNPGWQKLSPFYYYLGSDPLNNGMDWAHAALLAVAAVILIAVAFPLFQRRDIRQRD